MFEYLYYIPVYLRLHKDFPVQETMTGKSLKSPIELHRELQALVGGSRWKLWTLENSSVNPRLGILRVSFQRGFRREKQDRTDTDKHGRMEGGESGGQKEEVLR